MRETLMALAATLFFLIAIGGVDPNMTIGEFVGLYYEDATEQELEEAELPVIVIEDGELTQEEPATEEIILTPILEEEETVAPEEETPEEAPLSEAMDNSVPMPVEMMLYEYYDDKDVVEVAEVIAAEAKGRDTIQKAAVAWCLLNRVDAWGISIKTAANQAGAFEQSRPTEEDLIVARDVLNRWSSEKRGFSNSGRVLPASYKYFSGNGKVNRYRKEYDSTDHYDWYLTSPYV